MAGPVQSIERAAAILRLLAGGPRRLGLGEVAASLGLAKGTAHGILRTLQHVDFVEQDASTGKYQLGAALLHLGTSYLDINELRSRSINWADALAARSGEAVRLGTLRGPGPRDPSRVPAGRHPPDPGCGFTAASARLLARQGAAGVRNRVLESASEAGLEAYTRHTLVAREKLTRALAEVREVGWAAEIQEMSMGRPVSPRRSGARRPRRGRRRPLRPGREDLRQPRPSPAEPDHPAPRGRTGDLQRSGSSTLGEPRLLDTSEGRPDHG